MKEYKFLLKPLLFIFNLLFASWLLLTIERISPTDFSKYNSLFKSSIPKKAPLPEKKSTIPISISISKSGKTHLKKLCSDYKNSLIDSVKLDHELDRFLGYAQAEVLERKK